LQVTSITSTLQSLQHLNEIDALIRLLDDPDKGVYSAVEKKILSVGEPMIAALEKAWTANEHNSLLQKRVEKIVPVIESNVMLDLFREWAEHPDSMMKAAWLLSRLNDFSLTEEAFAVKYNELKTHLFQYGFSNYSPLEHIKIMNFIFFRKMGFKPCKPEDFTNPSTCYPMSVLDTKTGNPESLALLYMMYAQDAGLPVVGINLPKNFILGYHNVDFGTRFYINPTTSGSVFHKSEIDSFLKTIKLEPKTHYYGPCSNLTIVHRILIRLEYSCRCKENFKMADKILRIINALPGKLDSTIEWA